MIDKYILDLRNYWQKISNLEIVINDEIKTIENKLHKLSNNIDDLYCLKSD